MAAPHAQLKTTLEGLDFCLLPGVSFRRLHQEDRATQQAVLPRLFKLIAGEYPAWLALETPENWLATLNGGNARGTCTAASLIMDNKGDIAAASIAEIYTNGSAIINYSLGNKDLAPRDYLRLVGAATRDTMQAIADLQSAGRLINLVVKEHHLDSARAQAGFLAVAQVPLDGPTSLIGCGLKYYEMACGNPAELEDPAKLQAAMALTDPQTPRTVAHVDDDVHLWLLGHFTPSQPDVPLAMALRHLADAHAHERSIFRNRDIRLDPGWQSLQRLADHLPPAATYADAYAASLAGAAAYMGLP